MWECCASRKLNRKWRGSALTCIPAIRGTDAWESQTGANMASSYSMFGLNSSQPEKIKDELRVPSKVICHLIGQGAETLRQIQQQTSCTVQIQPPGPDPSVDRPVTLSGTRSNIEMCKGLIRKIISDNPVSTPSPPMSFSTLSEYNSKLLC
eukprot:sb/3473489/